MKYCGKCGQPLSGNEKFCGKCGAPIAGGGHGIKIPPEVQKTTRRTGRAIRAAAVAAALLIVAGGVFWRFKDNWFNPSAKYHTEETGFLRVGNDITYSSPIEVEHLRFYEAGFVSYPDNELLVQLTKNCSELDARKLAREYGAELVGFTSVAGTCQWRFPNSMSFEELNEKSVSLQQSTAIENVYLNQIMNFTNDDIPTTEADLWQEKDYHWGYTDVHANVAYEMRNIMKAPINIGIFDNGFQDHPDLDFITDYNVEETHGTHVMGIVAAIADNSQGIAGVYPITKERTENKTAGKIYGYSFQYGTQYESNPISFIKGLFRGEEAVYSAINNNGSLMMQLNKIARLLMLDCRVINMSFGCPYGTSFAVFLERSQNPYSMGEVEAYNLYFPAQIIDGFLARFINADYQFLLVMSAGNRSYTLYKEVGDSNTRSLESPYEELNLNVDVIKLLNDLDIKETCGQLLDYSDLIDKIKIYGGSALKGHPHPEEWYYSTNVPAEYNSPFSYIPNGEVFNRIIVVGAYDIDHNYASFTNSSNRVNIMAPGVNIFSTVLRDNTGYLPNGMVNYSGTSMSAPYVTGAIACVWALNKSFTAEEVRSFILNGTTDMAVDNRSIKNGGACKTLNVEAAMNLALDALAEQAEIDDAVDNLNDIIQEMDEYNNTSELTEKPLNTVYISTFIVNEQGDEIPFNDTYITISDMDTGEIQYDHEQGAPPYVSQNSDIPYGTLSPFYAFLPNGSYQIQIEANGYQTIFVENLNPTEDYGTEQQDFVEWKFVLLPDPIITLKTNLQSLISQYGIMPTGTGFFDVGMSGSGEKLPDGETSGLLFADIYDYDADGMPELLTFRNEPEYLEQGSREHMLLEMYESTENGCILAASMELGGTNLSVGGYFKSMSVFRYEKENYPNMGTALTDEEKEQASRWRHLPFIGVEFYSQFNSQNTTLITFQYWDGTFTTFSGANYGEWPGAEDRKSCYSKPVSAETAKYMDLDGDGFQYWTTVASSSNSLDQNVIDQYDSGLRNMGLSLKQIRSVYSDYEGTGGVAKAAAYCALTAKDCYESLDGAIVELGLISTEYAQAQQTLSRTDCLGSLDGYR